MRMEVVNRIESVIKGLWPSADVSTCVGSWVLRITSLAQDEEHVSASHSEPSHAAVCAAVGLESKVS